MPRPFLPLLLVTGTLWLGGDPLPPMATDGVTYPLVDTGQIHCYNAREEMADPAPGQPYAGQDAQYLGNQPQYRDQGDGTVLDRVTGLVWQQAPAEKRCTQAEAEAYARDLVLAGHDDWRLPSIKELFSIADFQGNMHTQTPYLDPKAFAFVYPEATGTQPGQRGMDAQYASSTHYLGITMGRDRSAFGFNFADGRIKSYPLQGQRYVRCVRGNPLYGQNRFRADADGTVTDLATGLVWQRGDSGKPLDWPQALAYAESLELAGHDDWRLPNVKELQSIVDYSRAPAATDPARRGPAIDPIFSLTDPTGWFWTGTTHIETAGAYYVAFGQATSARLDAAGQKLDAHGAGAVRSDPKTGDPGRWPDGLGPQADEVRILNFVRCVRGGTAVRRESGPPLTTATPPGQRFVKRLDRDQDGKVSRSEFDGPPEMFDRLDRNHDSFLGPDEAPVQRPRR